LDLKIQVSTVADEPRNAQRYVHCVVNKGDAHVAHSDKLATVVSRTKSTTIATVDVTWRKKVG